MSGFPIHILVLCLHVVFPHAYAYVSYVYSYDGPIPVTFVPTHLVFGLVMELMFVLGIVLVYVK